MSEQELKIIPEPVKVSLNDGVFFLSQKTTIKVDFYKINKQFLYFSNKDIINKAE